MFLCNHQYTHTRGIHLPGLVTRLDLTTEWKDERDNLREQSLTRERKIFHSYDIETKKKQKERKREKNNIKKNSFEKK